MADVMVQPLWLITIEEGERTASNMGWTENEAKEIAKLLTSEFTPAPEIHAGVFAPLPVTNAMVEAGMDAYYNNAPMQKRGVGPGVLMREHERPKLHALITKIITAALTREGS